MVLLPVAILSIGPEDDRQKKPTDNGEGIAEGADGSVGEEGDQGMLALRDIHLHPAEQWIAGGVNPLLYSVDKNPPAGKVICLNLRDGRRGGNCQLVLLKIGPFGQGDTGAGPGNNADIGACWIGRRGP